MLILGAAPVIFRESLRTLFYELGRMLNEINKNGFPAMAVVRQLQFNMRI